jgi:hypothetical protein
MSNAMTDDTEIYANGRTYAEHCAWIEAMNDDESLILHCPTGHRYTLVFVSIVKMLLAEEMPQAYRLRFLEWLDKCGDQWLSADAIAAVQPMCADGHEMVREAQKLGPRKVLDVLARCEVFNAFVALNSSLLTAIKICDRRRTV